MPRRAGLIREVNKESSNRQTESHDQPEQTQESTIHVFTGLSIWENLDHLGVLSGPFWRSFGFS
eukprot:1666132-Pyramimonas_sp.AAC.1